MRGVRVAAETNDDYADIVETDDIETDDIEAENVNHDVEANYDEAHDDKANNETTDEKTEKVGGLICRTSRCTVQKEGVRYSFKGAEYTIIMVKFNWSYNYSIDIGTETFGLNRSSRSGQGHNGLCGVDGSLATREPSIANDSLKCVVLGRPSPTLAMVLFRLILLPVVGLGSSI